MQQEDRRTGQDTAPDSFVGADAGIQLPDERTSATPGDTYEGVRDNEQLGRPRETLLREVQELAPPAAGTAIQNDQIGRQVVEDAISGETSPREVEHEPDPNTPQGAL